MKSDRMCARRSSIRSWCIRSGSGRRRARLRVRSTLERPRSSAARQAFHALGPAEPAAAVADRTLRLLEEPSVDLRPEERPEKRPSGVGLLAHSTQHRLEATVGWLRGGAQSRVREVRDRHVEISDLADEPGNAS